MHNSDEEYKIHKNSNVKEIWFLAQEIVKRKRRLKEKLKRRPMPTKSLKCNNDFFEMQKEREHTFSADIIAWNFAQ